MRRFVLCLLILSAGLVAASVSVAAVDPAVIEAENRRIALIENVAESVVAIFSPSGDGGGSGVLISPDGYAISNYHVTSAVGTFMKCGLNDGKLYDAVIVGVDPTGDVALIKMLGRDDFPFARMGDSDALKLGDWVFAMGNPFLLATDFHPTVTYGIVSGLHRYQYPAGTFLEYTDCIQIDASINPGNSGGPLFNSSGELVGINGRASFEKRGRVNSGAAYSISINQIKHFMDHLKSGRIVDHGSLGAVVTSEESGAVVVSDILDTSDAYRRGLREGDEIISFGGRPIRSVNQFKNILGIYPQGWKVPLVFRRDDERYETYVRLRRLHALSELWQQEAEPNPLQPEPKRRGRNPNDPEKGPDDETPEQPGQKLLEQLEQLTKPPDKHAHLHQEKRGFANYYFNELEQKRLLSLLDSLGDYSGLSGTLTLSGKTTVGNQFEFVLADAGAGLTFSPKGGIAALADQAFYHPLGGHEAIDEPPGTGGLLIAMHHLKLLLTQRALGFVDFYYLGSEPLDGRGELVDVLLSVQGGAESRWYFSKLTGDFVGFDTRVSDDLDECQVRFEAMGEFGGIGFPQRIRVSRADEEFATFIVDSARFARGANDSR